MTEPADQDLHQRQTLILAAAIVFGALAAVIAVVIVAAWLNQFHFIYFPLGFYLTAQGLLIGLAAAAFWFAAIQDRLDRKRDESEEL